MSFRKIAFLAGLGAWIVAGLILRLGLASTRAAERLIAEGEVTTGDVIGVYSTDSHKTDQIQVQYRVGDKDYRLYALVDKRTGARPVIEKRAVPVPRLGPNDPLHVVYLPSDPGIAQMRRDLSTDNLTYYIAAGYCALLGILCHLAAIFWRSKSRRHR